MNIANPIHISAKDVIFHPILPNLIVLGKIFLLCLELSLKFTLKGMILILDSNSTALKPKFFDEKMFWISFTITNHSLKLEDILSVFFKFFVSKIPIPNSKS